MVSLCVAECGCRYRTYSISTARRLAVDLAYQNMYILYVHIEYIYSMSTTKHIMCIYMSLAIDIEHVLDLQQDVLL